MWLKHLRVKRALLVLCLAMLSWLGMILPLASLLAPASVAAAGFLAFVWRSWLPAFAIAANPLTVSFGFGVADWCQPRPAFVTMGLPGYEFFNLGRDTRCYRNTGGCLVYGGEWVWQAPHNAGLRLMLSLFGLPPGTYHGPYPTKSEAIAMTEQALETPVEQFLKDEVLAGGRSITLAPRTAEFLLDDLGMTFFALDLTDSLRKVRACLIQNRCLVIRVSTAAKPSSVGFGDEADGIVLVDAATMHAFARYLISRRAPRIPRLLLD